jgi:hypothetical protein
MTFQLIGMLSGLVFIVVGLPYLYDTIKGRTKPQRVTWGVALAFNIVGFANQYASGADNSLWLFGASTFISCAIFIAALFKGVGGHSKLDIFAIMMAISGLVLWQVLESPLYSILANNFAAVVALLPTLTKVRRDPDTETRITWLGGMFGSTLGAISVGSLDYVLLISPVCAALLQAVLVYQLYFAPKARTRIVSPYPVPLFAEVPVRVEVPPVRRAGDRG